MLQHKLFACLIALCPSAALADGFVRIVGIDGDATAEKRKGWMAIDTLTEGVSNASAASLSAGGGAGKPVFKPVTFSKRLDSASPALRSAVATAKRFPTATIEFERPGEGPFVYYRITLSNVAVRSVDLEIGPDKEVETVALDFSGIKWDHIAQDPRGAAGAATSASATRN